MVKALSFFKRRAGMPVEEFQAYWRGRHPDVVTKLPGVRRYVQSHTRPAAYRSGEPVYDGIAEVWFAGVYGSELEGRFDDKADLLAHLLATEKVSPERAVMIGDRAGDIVGARANGVRSIGVLWGYGSESELVDARADGLCASPGELASCLGRLAL